MSTDDVYFSFIVAFQGLKFEIFPSTFEENLDKKTFKHPYEYAMATARCKTLDVAKNLLQKNVSKFFKNVSSVLWSNAKSRESGICKFSEISPILIA